MLRKLLILLSILVVSLSAFAQAGERPWEVTNEKTKIAAQNNSVAVAALADDVIGGSIVLTNLSIANSDLRLSLITAELDYRTGRHPGVTDSSVAKTLNDLAKKAGAPEFAYTDTAEVRRLRVQLLPVVPALFTRNLKRIDKNGKACMREDMAPIEATYLLARLIDAKLYSPDFQLTATERREKWADLHRKPKPPTAESNARTKQLLESAEVAARNGALSELGAVATSVVLNLGLRQQGGN